TTAPVAADRMTLTLSADPPNAKFFVDDTPVDGNPYAGPQKKDGVMHRIRVEAPGYDTERFALVFDGDAQKQITMKKTKYVGGVPVKPPPSAAPSATPDTTFKKPPREIDTSFPH